ncbi:MAG: hypothetical protein A2V88_14410 [Elusimicrobia bacterium RBG_16_66_12]|nr:MAG: hypothetical protein A2V88_14410 [Elusimicrobia bacterium RBG_16_66_12]
MEEDRSAKFSPSKLDVYKNCPRRYQYRYVDGISRRRKTPETTLGTAVHSAFEELYTLVTGGRTPSLAEVSVVFDKAFDEGWDESVQLKDKRFTRDDWRKVGHDCVRLYYSAHSPFTSDRTVAVEKRVGFPLPVEGREYRIEGFVDRLSLASDGVFEIHDYKTSKSLPSQEYVDSDWQLALYELAVRREWPDAKDVRLKWHYVRHGKTMVSVRDEAARERLRSAAAALVAEIKHDHAFEPRQGPLCDWCEYKDLCPLFSHPEKVAAMTAPERRKDDGVKLVDALAELEEKRRRLKDELKALDREKEDLDGRLADWAQAAAVSVVEGSQAQASVTVKDEIHLPTKTHESEKHAELEAEARRSPLWGDVSRLDPHALLDGVRAKRWSAELLACAESLLERYGRRVTARAVRLRRRRGADEE